MSVGPGLFVVVVKAGLVNEAVGWVVWVVSVVSTVVVGEVQ